MTVKIITAPSVEPVTLAEAKSHCRVDGSDDDALITALIVAARESAEHETGRALCTQTREIAFDEFADELVLRGAPVQSVTSVKYINDSGVETTLANTEYSLDSDSEPGIVSLAYGKSWPTVRLIANAVRVRYACGYGLAAAVPQSIKQWILLAVGTMYAQRETVGSNQSAALPDRFWHRLLDPYRIYEGL